MCMPIPTCIEVTVFPPPHFLDMESLSEPEVYYWQCVNELPTSSYLHLPMLWQLALVAIPNFMWVLGIQAWVLTLSQMISSAETSP